MSSRVEVLLRRARSRLRRLDPVTVPDAVAQGAVLLDIRPAAQRAFEGPLPGSLVVDRNILEWRCDPTSAARLPQAIDDDVAWVVVCSPGHTSSLAAAALLDLGLHRATDVVGGYQELARADLLGRLAAVGTPARPCHVGFPSSPWSIPTAAVPTPSR